MAWWLISNNIARDGDCEISWLKRQTDTCPEPKSSKDLNVLLCLRKNVSGCKIWILRLHLLKIFPKHFCDLPISPACLGMVDLLKVFQFITIPPCRNARMCKNIYNVQSSLQKRRRMNTKMGKIKSNALKYTVKRMEIICIVLLVAPSLYEFLTLIDRLRLQS